MSEEQTNCLEPSGSQSLDLFESWEQYRTKRVTGYTFRDCTSVMRLEFPPTDRKPTKNQLATMAELLADGWVVSTIHFENTEDRHEAKQSPLKKENQ